MSLSSLIAGVFRLDVSVLFKSSGYCATNLYQ